VTLSYDIVKAQPDGGRNLSLRSVNVESSRIGRSLRAARARLGWSREALAYHSGVSWSAIAQIESGRRKDIRLSSLSALADALDVSVDSLIGSISPELLEHRVLAYGSDEEYLAAAIPFLTEGMERSDCLLVVTTEAQIELVLDTLADRSGLVEFVDSVEWYRSPSAALSRYQAFAAEKVEAGAAWIRILAEAAWAGRSEAEITAWTRYESLCNVALASAPATIICAYDVRSFPAAVVADALNTHPLVAHGSDATASPDYRQPVDFLLDS
jgi:transcriptional regulator with XRE-family HTH domain